MKPRNLLLITLVALLVVFLVVTEVKAPLNRLANLPRCEKDPVILTSDFRANIISFATDYITSSTGEMYFKNHFFFHRLDYSLSDCVFVVRYQYTYDHVHTPMSVTIKASGPDDFQIIDSNVLLRPFMAIVSEATALELAEEQKIDYDYYNMEVDIEYQTMVYRFYKETLTEGRKLVFEVDARSKEIRTFQKPSMAIPIV